VPGVYDTVMQHVRMECVKVVLKPGTWPGTQTAIEVAKPASPETGAA
jgi:hypothetical protein